MNINELLIKQQVFTNIALTNGSKELSKSLKVKIMRIRIAYAKIKKAFEEDVYEFTQNLMSEDFISLRDNQHRSDIEEQRFQELYKKLNSEYQEFLKQKGLEPVDVVDDILTEEEYEEIIDVHSGNVVEINGIQVTPEDFLEGIYNLFVKSK